MNFFDFHHHNFMNDFGIYNLKLGENPPQKYFSAGIHPHSISANIDDDFIWLKEISVSVNCFAIGECGLDGLTQIDEKLQEDIFEKQIMWANEIKKPVIVHCVRKFHRLSHFKKMAKVPMIVHGFNKKQAIGDELRKNDFYLSFGKSLLYDVNLQDFFKEFPVNRIFLETDSADLILAELYEKVAALKNTDLESLNLIIRENLQNLQIFTNNEEKLA